MFARIGRQLASNFSSTRSTSAVEKRFFDVLFHMSRVGCVAGSGSRCNSTSTQMPTISTAETHINAVREVMRGMPHPVAILTTIASSKSVPADWKQTKPGDRKIAIDTSRCRGMTLSSLTSLSMSPEPLITFNIGFPSRTLSALTETRHFLIHVLRGNKKGEIFAKTFTNGNAVHEARKGEAVTTYATPFDELFQTLSYTQIRSHRINITHGCNANTVLRLPLLQHIPAVKSVLECKVLEESDRAGGGLIRIGDHVLVIAKVTGIVDCAGHKEKGTEALCYVDGTYARPACLPPMKKESLKQKLKDGQRGEKIDEVVQVEDAADGRENMDGGDEGMQEEKRV